MKKKIKTTMQSEYNISIIPVASGKTPLLRWMKYYEGLEPYTFWKEHYSQDGYKGVICGKVSENLESIEINFSNNQMTTNSMPIKNNEENKCLTKNGKSM